jgi:hypothetical protein
MSFFMTIPSSYPWANRSDMVAAPVCAPSFMVALAGEFYKFTKDMTESPVVLPVHLCVGEGAEHRVQTVKVHEGDTWKTRMLTFNITPAPAPATTPSPTSGKQ